MLFKKTPNENTKGPRKVKPWYDVHSHFLPGMDDGCKDEAESIMLLTHSRNKGVVGMIATPHYYPKESIERFLERREAAEERLKKVAERTRVILPEWCLGAEACYHIGLAQNKDLHKLCLGKSDYLLLELPFERWGQGVIKDLHELMYVRNITPVIAHLERYMKWQSREIMEQVYESGAYIQMNGEYVLDFMGARNAKKRVDAGLVDVLGSDAHNMTSRKPNIREAVDKLEESVNPKAIENMRLNNRKIFYAAMGKPEPQSK